MKRFIVTPFEWGSNSGYDFLNNDNPEADVVNSPHITWGPNNIVFERSYRIWEPGRMALSSLGVVDPDPDQQFNVPQIPQGAKVHGIKGTMTLKGMSAAVFYDALTGEELDPQPTYRQIFDMMWNQENGTFDTGLASPWFDSTTTSYVRSPSDFCKAPLYICMYKGTYNPYGSTNFEGGNIDSGPSDDPDTLLGVDITNPTVLEQDRIVWWDMTMITMPHRVAMYYPVAADTATENHRRNSLGFSEWRGHSFHTYNLNLDRNWIVTDDQVLWLHVMPGIVNTGLSWQDPLGNNHQIMYKPGFTTDLVASMLATPFTPGK